MNHEYQYRNEYGEELYTVNDLTLEEMQKLCNENGWKLIREVK